MISSLYNWYDFHFVIARLDFSIGCLHRKSAQLKCVRVKWKSSLCYVTHYTMIIRINTYHAVNCLRLTNQFYRILLSFKRQQWRQAAENMQHPNLTCYEYKWITKCSRFRDRNEENRFRLDSIQNNRISIGCCQLLVSFWSSDVCCCFLCIELVKDYCAIGSFSCLNQICGVLLRGKNRWRNGEENLTLQ